ncbi:hypothetical protein Hamer_G030315 [Homarus americanus]|uniref:DUF659 domain-containing protein n=1 Tax=Homarus americanus TaxID=6706 RepID=A0A8J5JUS7_HOMAM|nr:hypothetical protein Hamer_G030315 [Homarus americanus]
MMSNSLLERVKEETVTTAKEQVAAASSVAILCDGWTNMRNEGIITFVTTVPRPIFWSSTATGAESHTGEYMASLIKNKWLKKLVQ